MKTDLLSLMVLWSCANNDGFTGLASYYASLIRKEVQASGP